MKNLMVVLMMLYFSLGALLGYVTGINTRPACEMEIDQ